MIIVIVVVAVLVVVVLVLVVVVLVVIGVVVIVERGYVFYTGYEGDRRVAGGAVVHGGFL